MIRRRTAWGAALMMIAVAAALLAARNAWWSTGTPHLFRGDPLSERNVIIAGVEFARQPSVWTHWLLAPYRHQLPEAGQGSFFGRFIYTHYPPFPELFFYGLSKLGVRTVHQMRSVTIALNVLALVGFFWALTRLRDQLFGLIGLGALLAHHFFWKDADGLHEFGFLLPQQALLLAGLALVESRRAWGAALAWLAAFWQGTFAFEHQLWTLGLIGGFWAASASPRRGWPLYALIATGGPAAFAAHFGQLWLDAGSFSAAFADLAGAAAKRASGLGQEAAPPLGASLAALYRWYRPYVGGALAAPVVGALAVLAFDRTPGRPALKRFVGLLVGAGAWFILMRRVSLDQRPIASRVLFLPLALSYAIVTYGAVRALVGWRAARTARGAALAAAALALAAAIWAPLLRHDIDYLKKELAWRRCEPNAQAGLTTRVWAVRATEGLTGSALGLIAGAMPPESRFRSRECGENELCLQPNQTVMAAFADEIDVRAIELKLANRLPDRPVTARLWRVDPDNQSSATLLAEGTMTAAEATFRTLLNAPVRGRLFALELIAPLPRDYQVEYLALN